MPTKAKWKKTQYLRIYERLGKFKVVRKTVKKGQRRYLGIAASLKDAVQLLEDADEDVVVIKARREDVDVAVRGSHEWEQFLLQNHNFIK